MSKIYSFQNFFVLKTNWYGLMGDRNIQGFDLIYEQSSIQKVKNLTRIIYAWRIIPYNKIIPNRIEAS